MFKPELRDEINNRLADFAQVEMGNRVTPNNWNYLALTLKVIFDRNVVEPEKEEAPGD